MVPARRQSAKTGLTATDEMHRFVVFALAIGHYPTARGKRRWAGGFSAPAE